MLKNSDPAKGIVFVLILTVLVSGYMLVSSMMNNGPTTYAECVEAGYPTIENSYQNKCMTSGGTFIE